MIWLKDKLGLIIFILVLSLTILSFAWLDNKFDKPASPECKICHCHKTLCARECSEETMCVMQCQRLCDKRKGL